MGICGSLMDIFDSPQARSAKKQNQKIPFFILPYLTLSLTLLREVRLRLGRKNENFLIFILFFSRLAALCFAKLGCTSALQNKKNPFFILLCIRFALTLHPETQRTDLAACNLSKTMLKLSIVNCGS